jgi:hypothetical protein
MRFLILTHFGLNNQNAFSGGYLGTDGKKPQLYMHDAWTEYKVFGDYLDMGFGLHYWNGISRLSSSSTLNLLTLDAPIFNWATIETIDQFARKIGIYAKGRAGNLDYRLALSDPFRTNIPGSISTDVSTYSPMNSKKVLEGYFSYSFWEQESNFLPYYVGTYLGTKKVFNLGLGFLQNSDAMWSATSLGDTIKHDIFLLGADAFIDLPLSDRGDAITAYAVYYNYDFGPNNIRNIGILNNATSSTINNSLRGNAVPILGTGDIIYVQTGYLLPKGKGETRIQPYAAFSTANFEGIKNSDGQNVRVNILDIGTNFFLAGHHAKITLNYRNRPDFTDVDDVKRRSEFVLQTMIYL